MRVDPGVEREHHQHTLIDSTEQYFPNTSWCIRMPSKIGWITSVRSRCSRPPSCSSSTECAFLRCARGVILGRNVSSRDHVRATFSLPTFCTDPFLSICTRQALSPSLPALMLKLQLLVAQPSFMMPELPRVTSNIHFSPAPVTLQILALSLPLHCSQWHSSITRGAMAHFRSPRKQPCDFSCPLLKVHALFLPVLHAGT